VIAVHARRVSWVALVVAVVAGGCSREETGGGADSTGTTSPTSSSVSSTSLPTTTSSTEPPVTETPNTETPVTETTAAPTTLEEVTSEIVGNAVGGNSGGEGSEQTTTFSETVRNSDGTCSGWEGPGGQWTQGLESGAPVVFLAVDSDVEIGTGQLGTSAWEDVDPTSNEQWNCTFPFTGTIAGSPESFRVKVADLEPWVARRDATDPDRFVASVNTEARFDVFTSCSAPDSLATEVFEWRAVGTYWSEGINSLCGNGLVVVDLERPCRPPGFASDHIVAVTRVDDPSVVLEDAGGIRVDVTTLEPLTEVVVHIATGRPC
jgi:hypothetical protein